MCEPRRLQDIYIYNGHTKSPQNRWISDASEDVRFETTAENEEEYHVAGFCTSDRPQDLSWQDHRTARPPIDLPPQPKRPSTRTTL